MRYIRGAREAATRETGSRRSGFVAGKPKLHVWAVLPCVSEGEGKKKKIGTGEERGENNVFLTFRMSIKTFFYCF